jgi:hypothetical protein
MELPSVPAGVEIMYVTWINMQAKMDAEHGHNNSKHTTADILIPRDHTRNAIILLRRAVIDSNGPPGMRGADVVLIRYPRPADASTGCR